MLSSGQTFSIVLLPSAENLAKLNAIKKSLYGPEFNSSPQNDKADSHITLGIGLLKDNLLGEIQKELEQEIKTGSFSIEHSNISIQEVHNQGEDYLWVGIFFNDMRLRDLTNKTNETLKKYQIDLTPDYDNKLKSLYDSTNQPSTLIGNHISLGNRCLVTRKSDINKLLNYELPNKILIDRLAILSNNRDERYIWTLNLS